MYGNTYSVCPSGIFVPADSPYRQPADLAGVEVSVGFHSGSHYSAIHGLAPFLERDQIALHFAGRPNDRLRGMIDGRIKAANVWGGQYYLLEQLGFRKLVDTTFVMGFLVSPDAEVEDVKRYFRALLRAQQEIDIEPERYKHFWLKEMPKDMQGLTDVRRFRPGERIVSQPYTREIFGLTRAEVCKPRNDPLDIRFIENVLAGAYHDLNAAALQAYGTNQIVHFHYLLREFVNQLERHWKSSKLQKSMDVTETAAKFHQRFEKARRIRQGRKTNESSHH